MGSIRKIIHFLLRFIVVWFVNTLSLLLTAALAPGIQIIATESRPAIGVAAAAAFLLGVINFIIRPLILLLALPLGMILVFLVGLIVNASVLMLTSNLLPNFEIQNWWYAFLASIIFSAINTILTNILTINDEDSVYQGIIERLAKRRMFEGADTEERGLVMMEIDGLSYYHMKKAIEDGWMPNVKKMMDEDGYVLSRIDCGLPSQTSACQAGIMFGDNYDIPAFRWFDKSQQKLIVSSTDAPQINERYAKGQGLMREGSSINNMMNGDAHNSILTLADLRGAPKQERKERARDIYLLMLDPTFLTRTIVLFIWDVFVELWQAFRQRARDEQPRLNRLHRGYPLMRAATTIFMRDVSSNLAKLDIIRGSPSIYITWPGYDEVAHHSGPWTRDAFGTLKQYDSVIGHIRDTIEHKAPRPYELLLLSDHGQSFGATFLQRYDYTLKDFIEQHLPHDAQVIQSTGGDDGTLGMTAMAGELENVQEQDMGGRISQVTARGMKNAINSTVKMQTGEEVEGEPANVTVCGSGNLAQVYFDLYPRKITLTELNQAYPGMVDALVQHEGVGFVGTYLDDGTPVVLGKNGQRNLHTAEVTGEDPLVPYGDSNLRAEQVRRVADFPHAGDLIVISTLYPDGTVAAMEELIGNHGGLGGEQTDAMLFHPMDLPVPETKNSADVFHILNSRRGLLGPPAKPEKPAEEADVDAWSLRTIMTGIGQVKKWIPLVLRAMILDRSAYRAVAADVYMTGPALLLGIVGIIILAETRSGGWNLISISLLIIVWFLEVLVLYLAGRLLGGKGSYTAVLRGLGFAQGVYLLDLLSFIEPISSIVRFVVSVLAFFTAWMGSATAHDLKGWRSLVLPVVYVLVLLGGIFILATLIEGFEISIESLTTDFGLSGSP